MLRSLDAYYSNTRTNFVLVGWSHQEYIEAVVFEREAFLVEYPRVKGEMNGR
jgi:hypothetical protein